jgi:hypothetical protein
MTDEEWEALKKKYNVPPGEEMIPMGCGPQDWRVGRGYFEMFERYKQQNPGFQESVDRVRKNLFKWRTPPKPEEPKPDQKYRSIDDEWDNFGA